MRHGHAGTKRDWERPDQQRPLSARGVQQAAGLAETLGAMPVTHLVSSPYLRCTQTLGPLAARTGLRVTTHKLLLPDAPAARLDRFLADPANDGAVLCTHGEVLHELLARWRRRRMLHLDDGLAAEHLDATEKGAAWLVETQSRRRAAHYLRPLHIGPALPVDAI